MTPLPHLKEGGFQPEGCGPARTDPLRGEKKIPRSREAIPPTAKAAGPLARRLMDLGRPVSKLSQSQRIGNESGGLGTSRPYCRDNALDKRQERAPMATLLRVLIDQQGWKDYATFAHQYELAARSLAQETGDAPLALARLYTGDLDGAAEAVQPVLDLHPSQRNAGIIGSVQRVRASLMRGLVRDAVTARELREEIAVFSSRPTLALLS